VKKDVLLIAHFCNDFDGKGNNRFNYIANLLANNNFDTELITSDFSHNKKIKREKINSKSYNYKITFISEPQYSNNVSFKRFYSHYKMGKNLKKYLDKRKKPDIIYCAVPSLDVAKVAANYAKKNNVKFIIDIQDLWPEAFEMIFKIPIISPIIFFPFRKKANYIYNSADKIVSVSDSYTMRALKNNNKCEKSSSIYIGTDLSEFDKMAEINKYLEKPDNEIWIAYAGTLGNSYDLISIIDALNILNLQGILNIKFIVMGDGPLKSKFENYAKIKKVNANFVGRLTYGEMVGLLKACDIAVNPIKKNSAASIINKHGDYAAAGLPVLNTQESQEYRNLIEEYEAGINCINNDAKDISSKILKLYNDKKLRSTMGRNSRRLAEEKFDRKVSYLKILEMLK